MTIRSKILSSFQSNQLAMCLLQGDKIGRALVSDALIVHPGSKVILGLSESQPLIVKKEHNPQVLNLVLDVDSSVHLTQAKYGFFPKNTHTNFLQLELRHKTYPYLFR